MIKSQETVLEKYKLGILDKLEKGQLVASELTEIVSSSIAKRLRRTVFI